MSEKPLGTRDPRTLTDCLVLNICTGLTKFTCGNEELSFPPGFSLKVKAIEDIKDKTAVCFRFHLLNM